MRTSILSVLALVGLAGCGDTTCDPGDLCTWFGTPEVAGMAAEGAHRLEASTFWAVDLAFHPTSGDAYILDWNNHRIVTVGSDDLVHTVTGVAGELGDGPPGPADTAQWNHPTDITWDTEGRLVFAAWHNSRLVRVDSDANTAEFFAGTGGRDFGGDGGPASAAVLDLPCGVRQLSDGSILLADMANQRLRRIDPDGVIDTVAGNGEHGFNGDGGVLDVSFASPALQRAEPAFKFDVDADDVVYIADSDNGRIRKVDLDAGTVVTIAGQGQTPVNSPNNITCESGCGYDGDGGPAVDALLNNPSDVAVADDGTIYFTDTNNSCVRKIDPDGTIDTFAGVCGEQGYGDFGPPTESLLARPFGVAIGPDGAVYISDTYNSRIARVEPGA